ncbi:hypothetical protein ALP32_103186 [Pseudomonas avellanae]|uniref:Uncharacterized protein n=1 Tax=Pseudomonas avellanae TaxID=46257 RepID=A0A3M5STG1_9PSED|nr:hypothetical protein ALP32_103186 [Pseudomonas avellanae]
MRLPDSYRYDITSPLRIISVCCSAGCDSLYRSPGCLTREGTVRGSEEIRSTKPSPSPWAGMDSRTVYPAQIRPVTQYPIETPPTTPARSQRSGRCSRTSCCGIPCSAATSDWT